MSKELNDKQFYQASATLSTSEREAFINAIWKSSKAFIEFELSSYFEFLEIERTSKYRVDNPAYSHLCFKHIFDIQSILYENLNESPLRLQDLIQTSLVWWESKPEVVQDLIILVIRLTFMVRVEFPNPHSHPSPFQLQMQDNQNFRDTLRELQNVPPLKNLGAQNELPLWFNVIDLERKANLRIGWTDYLNEHLTFQNGTLMIFRHIAVLKYMGESGILTSGIFSSEFLTETQRSLLSFFPLNERKYSVRDYLDWFQNRGPIENWQRSLTGHDRTLYVSRFYKDFPFWHRRLLFLLSISNNQESWNIKRLWYDDRDQNLWWTRWGSITFIFLFALFGLIKSIMGLVLVVHAFRP